MATAKRIPNNNYQVQLTLSPVEARYLAAITGRVSNSPNGMSNIFVVVQNATGSMPYTTDEHVFEYSLLSNRLRDWVENGE